MSAPRFDYLIIGGGIIGLTVARELRARQPDARICLIEKEHDVAFHASGRNSGVLHAGFYYTADSLKARFTRDGNQLMRRYCEERGLQVNACGKLVVARNAEELAVLEELKRRGDRNGVALEWVDRAEAERIEPNVRTLERALYSPTTATVDPRLVCQTLKKELAAGGGVELRMDTRFLSQAGGGNGAGNGAGGDTSRATTVQTSRGPIEAGYVVNCAGLYADRVGRAFGFARDSVLIPFKGIYLKYSGSRMALRTNIYPVPLLANPFLGVHYTLMADGQLKIGPTAIPALWRENYRGFGRFRFFEFLETAFHLARLWLRNSFGFRRLAWQEVRKYRKAHLAAQAADMVKDMDAGGFAKWGEPGIRAQLLDTRSLKLVQDFVLEGDGRSLHVLNAVSPAFTCSFALARHIADQITRLKN